MTSAANAQADTLVDHTPPQAREAEMACLGAMMLDAAAAATASRVLRAADFVDPAHRALFRFLAEHREADERADLVTVEAGLRAAELLEQVGGRDYLIELSDSCPTIGNAASYCGIIRRAAAQREAIQAGLELARRAGQPKANVPELVKSLDKRMRRVIEPGGADGEADESRPVLTCLADVRPEALRWLWPGRIPLGKVTLVFGDPDLGKSLVTLDVAARVSRGLPWPDAPGERPTPGGVILLSAEDDLADTIRPRLDAAGADVGRIMVLQGVEYAEGRKGYFNLARDLPALEAAIRQTPDTRLVIIDPISAYLGRTDSHVNAEVRAALAPLSELAARHGAAVVGVTHLNKGMGGRALYRATGSLAFVAAARAGWLVTVDLDDPKRRLFLPAKMNLAEEPLGLAYRVVPVTLDGIGPVARVEWERDPVTMRANEALAAEVAEGESGGARQEAADWLQGVLADGPVNAVDVKKRATGDGIALRTLDRAKAALNVEATRQGFGGPWVWLLPARSAPSSPEERQG